MKNKNGFTLVELMATMIILITIMLIAFILVQKNIERSKTKSFIEEAETIKKAAQNKYYTDKMNDNLYKDDMFKGNVEGKLCYSIADKLIGTYVKKSNSKYAGSVEVCYTDDCTYETKIWLSDATFYINGKSTVNDSSIDHSTNVNYFNSCGYETIGGTGVSSPDSAEFDYSGVEERITILKDGLYAIEGWGASGGDVHTRYGGFGGYTYTELKLKKNDVLYINVGGEGKSQCDTNNCPGGYNGGTNGVADAASGGGYTTVSFDSGLVGTINSNKKILIAGPGSGATNSANGSYVGGAYASYRYSSNSVTYCYNCTDSYSNNTHTYGTTNISAKPVPKNVKKGNGYVKISLIKSEYQEETKGVLATDFSDYLRVEYIYSDKNQYIDTGYKATPNTSFDMDFAFVDYNSFGTRLYPFGATSSDSSVGLSAGFFAYQSDWMDKYGYIYNDGALSEVLSTVSCRTYDRINVKLNMTPGTFTVNNGEVYTDTKATLPTATSTRNIYLFANNNNGSVNYPTSMKLYSMKIYENNSLVRDYIPCYSKSTHEAGLCDLITKQFYKNKGTGYFMTGPVNNS